MEDIQQLDVGTKEGWREYVDAIYERPPVITMAELEGLPSRDRDRYHRERARYTQAGAFVKTPQFRQVQTAVSERVMLNEHRQVGRLGVVVSGEPAQGKTTTLLEIGKEHERRRRQTGHPAGADTKLPVAYVSVPAQCSAKALLQEFARFYALPNKNRMTYGEILDTVAIVMRQCHTELVLIDDVHHLDLRLKQNLEASDMLKQLSERCGGTFVYAGISVESTGLLSGIRGGQLRKRFTVFAASPFRIDTKPARVQWGDLLLSIEDSLCLINQKPGALLDAARDLHSLTGGEIGPLKNLLQLAGLRAILDGSEQIDTSEFRREAAQRQKHTRGER